MKLGRLAILAAVFLAGSFGATFGQATNAGDVSGTVTDKTGAVIPGANVTVINNATGSATITPPMRPGYTTQIPS